METCRHMSKEEFLNQSNETNPFYFMTEIFAHHIKNVFTN